MKRRKNKMNKKILNIIVIIVIVIVVGVVAFLIGRKSTDNGNSQTLKYETSSEKDIYNRIVSVVDEFCNENYVDVSLNADMIVDLTELYNKNPNNFNKETVGEYLMDNGWIARGVLENDTNSTSKQNNGKSTNSSSQWSDTEIRNLIQEDWNYYNQRLNEASISKIEKVEEDAKGRYIYAIYWSWVDLTISTEGWSQYQLYDTDINGKIKEITVYGVDTTTTNEGKPNVISLNGDANNLYEVMKQVKQNKELNWNK